MTIRYYDEKRKVLVYCRQCSSPQMWDQHWQGVSGAADITRANRLVNTMTARYLPTGAKVLEGGCGTGRNVYSLQQAGFAAYGLDYAAQTVARAAALFPELQIVLGDVRRLPFADKSFDGYWSIGVIEHFFDGYDEVAAEMERVIKPGGLLFLSFPQMFSLRQLKARRGSYPAFPPQFCPDQDNFYQFALEPGQVADAFASLGFSLVEVKTTAGLKGLKDEIGGNWGGLLQKMYDSTLLPVRIANKLLDLLLSPRFGHSALFVFRKKC
ncbi:MAG: class I SAM-dependent methyltransferase [Thermodesulfobacteriota bacterium]